MRRYVAGHMLAWVAVAVLTLVAPCLGQADLILPGPAAADEAPSSAPVPGDAPGRVGYAMTADEFIGGLILTAITLGGGIYLCILAGRNEL